MRRRLPSCSDQVCGTGGRLLIGVDLQKDQQLLYAAYNDHQRVTAKFNKNILQRINRELEADFQLAEFDHVASYNRDAGRIEMHLQSRCDQTATIDGDQTFRFATGGRIRTELSHKYMRDGFADLASTAGWRTDQAWTDPLNYFAVMLLSF